MRSDVGHFAGVADANACGAGLRRLRDQRAEPLGQFQVWPHSTVLVRGQRRKIHGVPNHAFHEVVADLQRNLRPQFFLRFGRGTSHVWRSDHVWKAD